MVLGLILTNISTSSFAYTISPAYWGKGPLKLSKNLADTLEYFFSSGKKGRWGKKQKQLWKPFFIVISPDGKHYQMWTNPWNRPDPNPNYVGKARIKCKKESGQECFVFAQGYKILWDNGINKKKRTLTKKEINAGKTLQILEELGFYGDSVTQTTTETTKSKKVEKKEKKIKKESKKKMNDDIVQQLKDLNELYKSGALTKEEFEKAKKKLLN